MFFKNFAHAALIFYLCACLTIPSSYAVETTPNLAPLQGALQSPPQGGGDESSSYAQDFSAPELGGGAKEGPSYSLTNGHGGNGEYISGYYPGAVLIPVTILGPVPKQGIHHIPTKTNLVKLISLAGGLTTNAVLSDVTIKRVVADSSDEKYHEEVIHVNADDLLHNAGSRGPFLQQDDLVLIKEEKVWFSNNTLVAIGLVGSLLGIVVSAIVIGNQLKR